MMTDPLRGELLSIAVTAGVAEMVAAWAEEGLKGQDKPIAREAVQRFRQAFSEAANRSLMGPSEKAGA